MSAVFASVRITTRAAAIWRICSGCSALAALSPDQSHCRDCRLPAPARRGHRRPLAA